MMLPQVAPKSGKVVIWCAHTRLKVEVQECKQYALLNKPISQAIFLKANASTVTV